MSAFWRAALRRGAAMGLSPAEVWALSVAEWRALCGAESGLSRRGLEALAAQYPDKGNE